MSEPPVKPSTPQPALDLPPAPEKQDGSPRQVGVEIELGGIKLDDLARRVRDCLGGEIDRSSDYAAFVRGTSLGDIRIEFDSRLFKDLKLRGLIKDLPLEQAAVRGGEVAGQLEKIMAGAAARIVPYEMVFPPLDIHRLGEIDVLREALRDHVEGTGATLTNAFGLHFNPEPPDTSVDAILRYLRAFLCLYHELLDAHQIDPARRISPFIDPFPEDYVLRVLDPSYAPDLPAFTSHYLSANPTRNRPLDLLPMLAWHDDAAVRARLPGEKIGRRPTLHYRLPDCRLDQHDWSVTAEWNRWARVERLACDDDALATACTREIRRLKRAGTHPLRRPRVAITGPDKGGFPAWLFTRIAVFRAAARPIRLRPGKFPVSRPLPPFDALIIGGGADVDPGRYRDGLDELRADIESSADERNLRWWLNRLLAPLIYLMRGLFSLSASGVDHARDAFEERCLAHALENDLPVLGICRGAQFINVHLRGSLHQGLDDYYGETGNIDSVLPRKRVLIDHETRIYRVFDRESLFVNSLHNQAVDRLGDGLRVCARDEAGVVQAIEMTRHPYLIGVQWHPDSRGQQRLFRELVRSARG